MPDTSGDEPDKADEAICPHDLASAGNVWDPKHIIIDDELHDLFVQLPANVLLEVYFDTCHSGDGHQSHGSPARPQTALDAASLL